MAASAEEAKTAVKEHYPILIELLELLPINGLVERLYSRDLLSFDRKSKLDSLALPKEKTSHFLEELLIPGLDIGYTGHFDEMVSMMRESDDILTREFVEEFRPDVTVDVVVSTSTNANAVLDSSYLEVDFNAYEDVADAYDKLFVIHGKAMVSNEDFRNIRQSLEAQASVPLRDAIRSATDTESLLDIFTDGRYSNWMDVRYLKVMANACGNEKLQSLIENYKHTVYSKRLSEIWKSNPYYLEVKDTCQAELKAIFGERDPDNVTVEELIKRSSQLAKKIAKLIAEIH